MHSSTVTMAPSTLLTLSATVFVFVAAVCLPHVSSFHSPMGRVPVGATRPRTSSVLYRTSGDSDDLDLKSELSRYLEKRKELNADEEAKREVGKVVGGTKGNVILDFVSGAPSKEFVIEEAPNIFDYDELTKYGFGNLVKPIMEAGGRREMYNLMGLTPPPLPERAKPKKAPKLVIDRTGETDNARYSGLKMGQVLDDEEMARALSESLQKEKAGERLRPKLVEEDYEAPFADKRNVGPKQTPYWTPQKLDEEGRKRGQAIAWARKAKSGEFVKDPFEGVVVEGSLRLYSIISALLVSLAFGRSSPVALSMLGLEDASPLLEALQAPALAVLVAAVGSSIVSGAVLAPQKNRSRFTWALKGLFGGPVAVLQLRGLEELKIRGEEQ